MRRNTARNNVVNLTDNRYTFSRRSPTAEERRFWEDMGVPMMDPATLLEILPFARLPNLPARPARAAPRRPATFRVPPHMKAFFRRPSRSTHSAHTYFAAASADQAYRYTRRGTWRHCDRGRIDSRILTRRPTRVDVSTTFDPHAAAPGWRRLQLGGRKRFSRDARTPDFFAALRSMLNPDRAALWRGYA